MKAMVIGSGGREHALVKALVLSSSIERVYAVPGSAGISSDSTGKAISLPVDWKDTIALNAIIQNEKVDFVVVGPEVPLVDGLADRLRELNVAVVGPSREAAQLEGSKIYSKEFMVAAGVPTARAVTVTNVEETLHASSSFQPPYVLKADGLAAGKGVFICKTLSELEGAARALFVGRTMGDAGRAALLEDYQSGYEISYLILTNGESFEPLVLAQDHKRLRDNDEGPNTGGMGVVAPVEIDAKLRKEINTRIIEPTLAEMRRRKLLYRGILYVGLMITPDGPSVIEYNARFGDPETQVILPMLDGDWASVFAAIAAGEVKPLKWRDGASACVVLAAEGYPDTPVKGAVLDGVKDAGADAYFLHAGTARENDRWVTAGGRVLNAIGLGKDLPSALNAAYGIARGVQAKGLQMRSDIGKKLVTKPSEH